MCPFLCQGHTVLIIWLCSCILKSGIMIPLALFFLFRIALTLCGLLWFYKNQDYLFQFCENATCSLREIVFNLQTALGNTDILTKVILPTHGHEVFFHLCHLSFIKFLSSMSYSFQSKGLSLPWLNLFLDTLFFLFQLYMELFS